MKINPFLVVMVVLVFNILYFSQQVSAQYREFKLTEEERAFINDAYRMGVFDIPGEWEKFEWRVKHAPRREGSIESALLDSSLRARLSRQLYAMQIGISYPHTFFDNFYVNMPILFFVVAVIGGILYFIIKKRPI